jgi:hypothetical protein
VQGVAAQLDRVARSQVMAGGANAFFDKPFDGNAVVETVRAIIGP